jgi:hypothetical protein
MKFTLDGRRFDTDKMTCISNNDVELSVGRWRGDIYQAQRSRRVFVHHWSQWDGETAEWHEADAEEIAMLANEYPALMDDVPEGEEETHRVHISHSLYVRLLALARQREDETGKRVHPSEILEEIASASVNS